MGLSIHYSGRLRQAAHEVALAEEVADICRDLGWNYTLLHRRGDEAPLYGIAVAPANSEPLFLTFLPDGRLLSPVQLITETDSTWYPAISTKTQYAGADTHMTLVKLLKYLDTKYFASLEVTDEGQYWETDDAAVLHDQFRKYNQGLQAVTNALSGMKVLPGESAGSLAHRLEQLLREKLADHE